MSSTPSTNEPRYATVNPRPRTRPAKTTPALQPPPLPAPVVAKPGPKTIKVIRKGKVKNEPTGDHPVGYGRTSVETQFQPGCKPGPGRPRSAVSQDTLLKKHLVNTRPVTIEGKVTRLQARELLVMKQINDALKGDRHAASAAMSHSLRLFGDGDAKSLPGTPAVPVDMDAHDHAILAEFKQSVREQDAAGIGDADVEPAFSSVELGKEPLS